MQTALAGAVLIRITDTDLISVHSDPRCGSGEHGEDGEGHDDQVDDTLLQHGV